MGLLNRPYSPVYLDRQQIRKFRESILESLGHYDRPIPSVDEIRETLDRRLGNRSLSGYLSEIREEES